MSEQSKEKNKKRRWLWQLPFLLFLILGTVYVIRQQHDAAYQHDHGFIFGTTYNITYQYDKNLQKEIEKMLNKVDASLSPFNEKSIISKVNRNEDVVVDAMFAEVFKKSMQISDDTHGAFDITVAPLVNAWGFGFKHDTQPTDEAIDSLLELVGYHKVSLTSGKRVKKADARIQLDCSAVAKGYGSDMVARMFDKLGIMNYMVEIGGEIVTKGVSDKRLPWHIGVTVPTDDTLATSNEIQTILNVTDIAMATSGNYRNFYYQGNKKVAHTIDPRTGKPVQHTLLSATVLAPDCATADAYATSFMVMGKDSAIEVLSRHKELMAYFIYSSDSCENETWYSPNLQSKIQQ